MMHRRYISCEDGNVAVEFALIAPFILLILVGIVDFGMYVNQRMQLENLARSAAEYVVKGGDEEVITADVLGHQMSDEDIEEVTFESDNACECDDGEVIDCEEMCPGGAHKRQFFSFSMTRTFTPIISYPGIPDRISMTGNARLQIQ